MDNILTIDLEEWYHPEYVKSKAPTNKEERVTRSLNSALQLLSEHNVNATFFVVGELAEKHSDMMETIRENGHEVAFHGYYHEPLWKLDTETFRLELRKFDSLARDKCIGFRAPSFSLNNKTKWALKVLEDAGYKYDSSIFPTKTPLYGVWMAPTRPYKPSYEDVAKEDDSEKLWEFPLLVYSLSGLRIPIAGGFYLRLFPVNLVKRAIKKANKRGAPAVLYLHSWELDPEMSRLRLGAYRSFVTYYNIEEVKKKFKCVLSDFEFVSFRNYIEEKQLA